MPKDELLYALFYRHDAEHNEPEHMHEFTELVIVLEGTAIHCIDGVKQTVSAGNVFAILPGQRHRYENPQNFFICNILFYQKTLADFASDLAAFSNWNKLLNGTENASGTVLYVAPVYMEEIIGEARNITNYTGKHLPGAKVVTTASFLKIIYLLAKNSVTATQQIISTNNSICNAMRFMKSHFSDHLSLAEIARKVNMSESSFRHNFKKIIGVSPIKYLLMLRIEAAQKMLVLPSVNIMDIALAVGINDNNYFCRQFKNFTGCTPSQFRQREQTIISKQNSEMISYNQYQLDNLPITNFLVK